MGISTNEGTNWIYLKAPKTQKLTADHGTLQLKKAEG
jgi:hypothetical protein